MKRRWKRRPAGGESLAIRTMPVHGDAVGPSASLWAELSDPMPEAEPLEGAVTAEVCVIGLGSAGLAATLELASNGADVIGIDAAGIGGTASLASAGMWFAGLPAMHHDVIEVLGRRRATALYQATRKELAALQAAAEPDQHWPGSVRIAANGVEEADCRRQLAIMRRDGLPVEEYEGPEGRGLLFPEDGTFQPVELARRRVDAARAAGARLYARTRAQQVGERDAEGATGEITCGTVIIAVDGGLEMMVPALEGIVRTGSVRAAATAPASPPSAATLPPPPLTPPPSPVADDPDRDPAVPPPPPTSPPDPPPGPPMAPPAGPRASHPIRTRWGRHAWVQLPDGRVIVTDSTEHPDSTRDDADGSDADEDRMTGLVRDEAGATSAITHRWQATSGFTDDRLPIIARLGPATIAVGGYNGAGDLLGPMLGRAAANLAMGRDSQLADLLTATDQDD